MTLKPANHFLLVEPRADPENEHADRLIVVVENSITSRLCRGILVAIGGHIDEEVHVGSVVYYSDYIELRARHLVNVGHLIAFEDDE